jgi:hypothetical protein
MVRFSDMLGGNGDPEGPRPIAATDARPEEIPEPADEAEPDAESGTDIESRTDIESGTDIDSGTDRGGEVGVVSALQSPEDVLDRLTQYASSARASDSATDSEPPAEPTSEPPDRASDELAAVGDDLLPHPKADTRKRRRK